MHHIAAHINYGSQMSAADEALIAQIMPLEDWHYYCYMANPVLFNPALNKPQALAHVKDMFLISLRLFLQNPTVDFNHTFCAGSLVYRVLAPFDGYFYAAALSPQEGGLATYIDPNEFGFKQTPIFPKINAWYIQMLEDSRNGNLSWLIWRPALYLYTYLFFGCILMVRARSLRVGLYLIPGLIQSATLFLVNIGQSFRYQYGIYLLGIFSITLLFLQLARKK